MSTSAARARRAWTPRRARSLWKRDDLPCRHYRGPSSSLVLFENLVILTIDGADLQYHAALDKQTGQTVWKTDRSVAWNDENVPGQMAKDGDMRKAHSTPLIVTAAGKPQMLSAGAKAAYGYDPRTGRELWQRAIPRLLGRSPAAVRPRPGFHRHWPDEEGTVGGEDGRTRRRDRHRAWCGSSRRAWASTPRRFSWMA